MLRERLRLTVENESNSVPERTAKERPLPLITKYRPRTWADVVGQTEVVSALEGMIKSRSAQTFLLTGPAGTGKTSLARIAAREAGCMDKDILEVNAASKTGIDDMRAIVDTLQYIPFGGGSSVRAVILDESHRLSGNAWDSLLKATEEPPPHVLWFLCTTDPRKIPPTIKTRCAVLVLKPVNDSALQKLLARVCKAESIRLEPDVANFIVSEAHGSPRQLLSNIAVCHKATDRKQAASLLQLSLESDATLQLCRCLANGGSWSKAMKLVEALKDEPAESVRINAVNYFAACARTAKTDKQAIFFLTAMEAFATPWAGSDGQAQLVLAVGKVVFAGD